MSRLPFGTRVDVAAVVEPRYLTWQTERTVFDPTPRGGLRMGREVPVDPPVLTVKGDEHEPLGDPLPDTTGVPAEGLHRRLRRFGREASGVVVGWVWRAEGAYHEGYVTFYMEPEEHGPYLDETGRHRMYQVALDPGEVGRRFVPADVVLVHPDDTEVAP